MGEPPAAFKAKAVEAALADKKAKVAAEVRRKRRDEDRRKAQEKKASEKKAVKKEDEKMEEEPEAKEPEETVEEAIQKAMDAVELTNEEKKLWFRKEDVMDMHFKELSKQFTNFTIPSQEEGFDEIKFVWQPEEKSAAYLKEYILEKK